MRDRLRPAVLAREVLLLPVLAGAAVTCLLVAVALTSTAGSREGAANALAGAPVGAEELAIGLSRELVGPAGLQDADERAPGSALATPAARAGAAAGSTETPVMPAWDGDRRAETLAMPRRGSGSEADALAMAGRGSGRGADALAAAGRGSGSGADALAMAGRGGGRGADALAAAGRGGGRGGDAVAAAGRGGGRAAETLAMPVAGVVAGCGTFGCPRPGHRHNGVDFLAAEGTPVRAAASGRVALVQSPAQSAGYGNFVCVQHRPALATCYAHLSAVAARVVVGARLRRGQVVGLVGATGSASSPHLHFEVRRGPASCQTCAVDPLALLRRERGTPPPPAAEAGRDATTPPAAPPRAPTRPPTTVAPAQRPRAPAPESEPPATESTTLVQAKPARPDAVRLPPEPTAPAPSAPAEPPAPVVAPGPNAPATDAPG